MLLKLISGKVGDFEVLDNFSGSTEFSVRWFVLYSLLALST